MLFHPGCGRITDGCHEELMAGVGWTMHPEPQERKSAWKEEGGDVKDVKQEMMMGC